MSRPGFYFLICPDSELIRQRVDALLRQYPPSGDQPYERRVFWADEGLGKEFWNALTLQDLFSIPKAIILRRAQGMAAADWESLSAPLARFNAQAWLFICMEGEFERGKPKIPAIVSKKKFWKFSQKQKWFWQSPGLTPDTITNYVKDWAVEHRYTFAPNALQALSAVLPPDAVAIGHELDKIQLAMGEDTQVQPHLAELISYAPEMNIFEFIDALVQGRTPAKVWQKVLLSQVSGERMLFHFLAMLVRETRILWQLYFNDNVKLPPFLVNKKQSVAQRLGPARLSKVWELALEAELGVKTGERNEVQAMELLVAGLADVFQGISAKRSW